jgi:hypothetical protein
MPKAQLEGVVLFVLGAAVLVACTSGPGSSSANNADGLTAGPATVGAPDLRLMCAVGPDVGERPPGVTVDGVGEGYVNDPMSIPCCFENGKRIDCPDPVPPGSWCTDTRRDRDSCGGCGIVCGATDICTNGACTKFCEAGLFACGTSHGSRDPEYHARNRPYCADLNNDRNNCGSCGVACADGFDCVGGGCVKPPTQCNHNGRCERSQGENANSCPDDCACGPEVACDTVKAGTSGYYGAEYCRLMTQVNAAPGAARYEWYTQADVYPYCDNAAADRCVQIAKCGGRTFTCNSVPDGWTETPSGCN